MLLLAIIFHSLWQNKETVFVRTCVLILFYTFMLRKLISANGYRILPHVKMPQKTSIIGMPWEGSIDG
jgi:hypothetical protein